MGKIHQKFYAIDGEIWRDVVTHPGIYQVSNLGRVKSLPKQRGKIYYKRSILMSQKLTQYGYFSVSLSMNKKKRDVCVHILVAEAFIPNPDRELKPHINHIDCVRTNNHVNNLEWCDTWQNMKHAIDMGRIKTAQENPSAKLTDQQAFEIFQARERHDVIALKYNVSVHTVRGIKRGSAWSTITGKNYWKDKPRRSPK